jgi:hypothetical protein
VELRERLNLAKDKKGVLDNPDDDQWKMKCFRCQELGHHQKDLSIYQSVTSARRRGT